MRGDKEGSVQWTVGKLLSIVLLTLLLVLVIWGFSVGGMGPLMDSIEGRVNEILILLHIADDPTTGTVQCKDRGDFTIPGTDIDGKLKECSSQCYFWMPQSLGSHITVNNFLAEENGKLYWSEAGSGGWIGAGTIAKLDKGDMDRDYEAHKALNATFDYIFPVSRTETSGGYSRGDDELLMKRRELSVYFKFQTSNFWGSKTTDHYFRYRDSEWSELKETLSSVEISKLLDESDLSELKETLSSEGVLEFIDKKNSEWLEFKEAFEENSWKSLSSEKALKLLDDNKGGIQYDVYTFGNKPVYNKYIYSRIFTKGKSGVESELTGDWEDNLLEGATQAKTIILRQKAVLERSKDDQDKAFEEFTLFINGARGDNPKWSVYKDYLLVDFEGTKVEAQLGRTDSGTPVFYFDVPNEGKSYGLIYSDDPRGELCLYESSVAGDWKSALDCRLLISENKIIDRTKVNKIFKYLYRCAN